MNGIQDYQKLESVPNASRLIGILKENQRKSNGRLVDEAGNKYNRLTVIAYAGSGKKFKNGHDGGAAWLCRCDCGKEVIMLGTRLRQGVSKSCGCLWNLPKGEGSLNSKMNVTRRSAERRGYKWELTRKEFKKLTDSPCFYCGLPPANEHKGPTCNGSYMCNGIDRVNNSLGYISENVVPCCPDCNRAKRMMSVDEFTSWFVRVAKFNKWECDFDSFKFNV